jgi:hypothetical protein
MKNLFTKLAATAASSAALSGAIALSANNPAQAITFQFSWQGDAGYSAIGKFSYDETTAPAIISESGPGLTKNLQSLMVSFFDPSNKPLQSFNTVAAGVSESQFFKFNFDTSTQTLFGPLDLGGGMGIIGEQFFQGTIGRSLVLKQDVDQINPSILLDQNSGSIKVSRVPEPASVLGLLALGALGGGSILKKKLADSGKE